MRKGNFFKLCTKFKVKHVLVDYNCGGDETNFDRIDMYNSDGEEINSAKLKGYFAGYVLDHCDLQDASDDYYMGEAGTMKIEVFGTIKDTFINEIGEEEVNYEYDIIFEKEGFSYYREEIINDLIIPLEISMINLIKEKVSSIYGGDDWVTVNFKNGITCSEEEEIILNELKEKINLHCAQFTPQTDIEILSFYNFNTKAADDDDEIEFLGDGLRVNFINYYDRSEPTS